MNKSKSLDKLIKEAYVTSMTHIPVAIFSSQGKFKWTVTLEDVIKTGHDCILTVFHFDNPQNLSEEEKKAYESDCWVTLGDNSTYGNAWTKPSQIKSHKKRANRYQMLIATDDQISEMIKRRRHSDFGMSERE